MKIKAAFLCALGCVLVHAAICQGFVQNDFGKTVKVFDADGKSFVNPYIDFEGSPFFISEWKYGKLKLSNQTEFTNVQFRLNLLSQQVHYLYNNVEMVVTAGLVKEVTLYDTSRKGIFTYHFACGFPPVDNKTEKNFFLILCEGKVRLLESEYKKDVVETDALSGEVKKEFKEYDEYYVFADNKMQLVKRDKAFLLGVLQDKQAKIEAFVAANKLSYKSMADIEQIINYYNSLSL